MVANKYAFLQITRRRFLNEWEAFKKVISRRNIRILNFLDESPERKTSFIEISRGGKLPYKTRSEERFSRNAETDLVCRLLLEKKKPRSGCSRERDRKAPGRPRRRERAPARAASRPLL